MLLSQFLNIIPIVALLQLAVWVWYIDKRSAINQIMAAVCLLSAINNTLLYCYTTNIYTESFHLLTAIDTSIWGLLFFLIIIYLILFVEHPSFSKPIWKGIILLINLPLILSPIFTIPLKQGDYQTLSSYIIPKINTPFNVYFNVIPFIILGLMSYIISYARFQTTNYRIQKQASLIIIAFIVIIIVFIPQLILWNLGYSTTSYLQIYPQLILYVVIIYAMSKYRAQSLSTSSIVSEMIEQASELTMVVVPSGEILSVNNHAERFLGYKKNEIEHKLLYDIVENSDLLRIELNKIETEQNYTPVLDLNIRLHNNSTLFIRIGITAIRNKFRETLGYYFVFYAPVEEVKQLEDLQTRFGLSSREKDVAMLLVKGMSNQDIADQLFISLATVKTHSNNIYRKTSSTNKLELKKMVVITQ